VTPARWAAAVALAFALYFAIQGGEYGTTDLLELRADVEREQGQVTHLKQMVDSLTRDAEAIRRDPLVQERVARESFGMIRKGEYLFRIVPTDTSAQLEER
jgi:cell division protein FtsB